MQEPALRSEPEEHWKRELERLEQALADKRALLDGLARIGPALASELDPDRLMQRLTDEATALVGAQFGAFFYNQHNASGESYMLYTLSGAPREAFDKFGMPRNTAVFGPTFAGEGVVRSPDITQDPRYGKNPPNRGMPEGHLPVRSYLAVPVRSLQGEVLGGLFFGHPEPGRFAEREERAALALSGLAGPALGNARLFQQLAEREVALQSANLRYQLVSEALREGIWYWDVATGSVEWNDGLLAAMGISRSEWGGGFEDWFSRVHPDDRQRLQAALSAHLERREPYAIDRFRLRHASGEYRWFETAGHAEWDAQGKPLRMAGSVRDITERTRTLETNKNLAHASAILGRSIDYQETLANLAQAMVPAAADWCAIDVVERGSLRRIAVAHSDPEKVRLAYEIARRYPTSADAPHGAPQVIRTGRAEILPAISEDLLAELAHDEEHLALIRQLGVSSYIAVPMTAHGRVLGAISLVNEQGRRLDAHDVAFAEELASRGAAALENALLYRQLRELNASLERRVQERTQALVEANAELESFSYSVSHDLRAPIRHISGFVDLLRAHNGELMDDKSLRYIDTIKKAASQMGTLIDGLLAFSRLGRAELARRPVVVAELVSGLLRELEVETRGRDIVFEVGTLPVVSADGTMLRAVLANLLGNAVKYTRKRDHARIEIAGERREGEDWIWVKDNGAGFKMEYAHKLFGVFQRLHSERDFDGTGIGLATSRRIVHRHGGRIWAESVEGQGASFYFTLPHAEPTHE